MVDSTITNQRQSISSSMVSEETKKKNYPAKTYGKLLTSTKKLNKIEESP